jgi:AcrR family transcriptional regulator
VVKDARRVLWKTGRLVVAQVKKQEVRDAILESARALFSRDGYHATTLNAIAKRAKLGVGNIYLYFPSKLHLLYEIYRPWFQAWMADLEAQVNALQTPQQKLEKLLVGLWHDFPQYNPGLANSLMEALSSNTAEEGKPNDLLAWTEGEVTKCLATILPKDKHHLLDGDDLSHVLMMAQDGFIINYRWGDIRAVDAFASKISRALFGVSGDRGIERLQTDRRPQKR